MADTIEKIIKIESAGSEQTVKGLKKEIDSLRDALLNTEKGSEEYKKVLEQLIGDQKKLQDVMSAGKNEVSAATGSYNALKNEMSALKKVWAEVTDEASRSQIGARIDEINTELKEMDASIGNFQRNVGNYADGFKNARQELAALKNTMDNVQEGTAEYNQAFQRASEITHNLQERQEMLKYSSADLGTQLSNVASIGASLVGGFNAINSVIALTGEKSEDLQKVMVKLQAGIALVQGLQGLEGMTKRMKGLVDGLTTAIFKTNEMTVATNAQAGSTKALATAQEANAAATTTATVATNAFGKALVATGIGAIVVLLGTLIAHWEDLKDMIGLSNEKLESFRAVLDKAKEAIVGVANAIGNILITPIKNAITYISTLGKVMKDVFTLNFSQIGTDIKEGFEKIKENVKKGYDVVGNYQKGAAKQRELNEKKAAERAAKLRKEELEDYIKDMEAQKGADWKYTEEGKKAYDEYFEKKIAGYKKDSKEYKEALREKWAYDREYQERLKKAEKSGSGSKSSKELVDQRLKEAETVAKRAEEAIKEEEQKLKEKYEYEKQLLIDYHKDTTALEEEYQKNLQKIREKAAAEQERKDAEAAREKREKSQKAVSTTDRAVDAIENKYGAQQTKIELDYSLKEATGTGKLSFADLIEETNKIYELNKQKLQEQADEYKALMENADADDEAKLTAKKEYEAKIEEIQNLETQNLIDNIDLQKEAVKEQIHMYSDLANAIGDIFGSIADILEDDIKAKVKNGEITQEEGEKQFKAVKAFQIAQATIQTISGAIAAFMSCQSLGFPWGTIIGAVQAAAVTAAGIAQIAKIKNTQLGGGGSSISGQMSAGAAQTQPEEYVPQYTQNATGESEIVNLANSIKDQRVYVVESDITEAQNRSKVRVTESTW